MSSARTPRTMSSTRSNASPSFTSRQAAPMQKRGAGFLGNGGLGQHLINVEVSSRFSPVLLA